MTEKSSEQIIREAGRVAMMEAAITGACYMKMTIDDETKEIKLEILNPFKGCDCEN